MEDSVLNTITIISKNKTLRREYQLRGRTLENNNN
jgi:hypothetical protein